MKVSRNWLQTYFSATLPEAEALSDALTFHVFEIDGIEEKGGDSILDVKVTANRGHDCLSHRGIAKELSAILDMPMIKDPLRVPVSLEPQTDSVEVTIENPALCNRYVACLMRGVSTGPSPEWLVEALESIGQRSINNVVDATNYAMFGLGQPLHAFDASKLKQKEGTYSIAVRSAREGEKLTALDNKEYSLNATMLVIADQNADASIGIAGIKGGLPASITESTTDIILESAHFNGVAVRKAAQALKLRTDASARFEQGISAELAGYGMRTVVDLILSLAGGEIVGFRDEYPIKAKETRVAFSTVEANRLLGTQLTDADVIDILRRLDLAHAQEGSAFSVFSPFERLDVQIPEDLVEEVGRINGYDKIPAIELPPLGSLPNVNPDFYWSERIRAFLVERGFSEVFTSVFADKGARVVLNKVDGIRPYLRENLDGLQEALERNARLKDVLSIDQVKLFEIGTVWHADREEIMVAIGVEPQKRGWQASKLVEELNAAFEASIPPANSSMIQIPLADFARPAPLSSYETFPISTTERYQSFSRYPYIVRDVALWAPSDADPEAIAAAMKAEGGELLLKAAQFDRFEKEGRVSYAFRLIFQSFERTLTDAEVSAIMEKINALLVSSGYEVR